jgi:sigma-E factor negative regulatory protein RseA
MHAEPEPRPADLAADEQSRLWLSACVDGQADALDPACRLWRDDAQARQTWHRYQLIGDVLRSGELATAPAHDAAFLAGLRLRLAAEPVALAPAVRPLAAARRPAWRPAWPLAWPLPAAMAAGFVLVAGAFTVARLGPVSATGDSAAAPAAASLLARADPPADELSPTQITDPRLDEFLRAHQAMGGAMQAAAPGARLRRVDVAAATLLRP